VLLASTALFCWLEKAYCPLQQLQHSSCMLLLALSSEREAWGEGYHPLAGNRFQTWHAALSQQPALV
jgi:hypothetical protein